MKEVTPLESHAMADGQTTSDRRLGRLASTTRFLLGCMIVVGVLVFSADGQLSELFSTSATGGSVTEAEFDAVVRQVASTEQLSLLGVIVTAIAFISWFTRAYKMSGVAHNEPMDLKPGWAVGAWFVPILNLVRPYKMMKEMILRHGAIKTLVRLNGWWWGLWIVSGMLPSLPI